MKIPTKFPVEVIGMAGNAKIRQRTFDKGGVTYSSYVVDYVLNGKRVQTARTDFVEAHAIADEAVKKMANEEAQSTLLVNGERFAYLRAIESAAPTGKALDIVASEYAEAVALLGGRVSLLEATRFWLSRHVGVKNEITVLAAAEVLAAEMANDGKSHERRRQVAGVLKFFAVEFTSNVSAITNDKVSRYLAAMKRSERSKRNHRDVLVYFNGWLCLRGYLAKGTDWFEDVQNYSNRKMGKIEIFTPEELVKILSTSNGMTPFIAIGAFAGLRHSEIARLNWAQVELSDKTGESFIEVLPEDGTKAESRRRLVPVCDNLKAWLLPVAKKSGRVTPYDNTTKQLLKIAELVGVPWKDNGLRHSAISYRVAATGDVARVADDSGNSSAIIKTNYLRRVKPAVAKEWFAIMPPAGYPNLKANPQPKRKIEADKV